MLLQIPFLLLQYILHHLVVTSDSLPSIAIYPPPLGGYFRFPSFYCNISSTTWWLLQIPFLLVQYILHHLVGTSDSLPSIAIYPPPLGGYFRFPSFYCNISSTTWWLLQIPFLLVQYILHHLVVTSDSLPSSAVYPPPLGGYFRFPSF